VVLINNNLKILFLFSLSILSVIPLPAESTDFSGFVALEGRSFLSSPEAKRQHDNNAVSFVIAPEIYNQWESSNGGYNTITFKPFARFDTVDGERSHLDIRQLDWLHEGDEWELSAGVSKVYWGVVESRHLVDIINQTDAVEDVDQEDKLGQPMVQLAFLKDYGNFRFYYLPYFRERTFSGIKGRLNGGAVIDSDLTKFESNAKNWHPDIAFRYDHNIDDIDFGISHFSGTSREAAFLQLQNLDGETVLAPFYQKIEQTSIDVQLTTESWLWKLEAMTRSGQDERFNAISGGLEYSFFGIFETDYDLGVLAEYHRDDRGEKAPATIFDNDIFIGSRLALNDVSDTAILAGVIIDINNGNRAFSMEASRRFADRWKVELDARFYANADQGTFENRIRRDDHIQLRVARYF